MAEALFINGVGMLLKAVTAHVESEIALAWGAKGELEKLRDKLGILQLVLEDAEKRQVKEPSVRHWLEKLKKVAYEAQDVMDDFSYETTRQEKEVPAVPHQPMKQLIDLVLNFCSSSNPFLFQLNMAHMIQDINAEFDKIKRDMEEYNFIKGNVPLGPYNPGDAVDHDEDVDYYRESHSSSGDESKIVGREAEKSRLVALLTDPASEERETLSVLPIVGMGGLGKTTLTQLIYNDEHTKNYFKDLRMWVYVSRDFDVKRLLADVISKSNDGSGSSSNNSSLEELGSQLRRNLGGKQFLLVLDDVWNEVVKKWEDLRDALLCGAKGSKIIVTTRKHEVASLVGTLEACQLHPLSKEEAWSLFKQRAFQSPARSEKRQDLVEVGKRVAKKCGGVPLALKIIGSQLKSKGEDLGAWQFIENVEIWDQPEIKEIFKVLKVSYLALPSHLKQCFSYCSVFRKGESIEVDTLVQLWMAEGFINIASKSTNITSSNNNENIILEEDVGRQYAKSLLNGCFFQAEKKNKWEEVVSFKMHDLVHDLAQSTISPVDQTSVMVDHIEKDEIARSRRLQVAFTREGASPAKQVFGDLLSVIGGDNLRVLILNNPFFLTLQIKSLSPLMNLKRLRVLILKDIRMVELPNSIANLKHLRYLDLSHSWIKVLPGSFTALYNLQTLKLSDTELSELPSDITRKLINLRHVKIGGLFSILKMPKELSHLKFLQTLQHFQVSKESGCHISELKFLHHLRDDLIIEHLENVENREAAESANLMKKQKIRVLHFVWSIRRTNGGDQHGNYNEVLEGLRPHSNLRGLRISNFMGAMYPTWLKSSTYMLPNLVEVELHGLKNCDCLPALGSFPILRILLITDMDLLVNIGSEFYGDTSRDGALVPHQPFPCLKKLSLLDLKSLEEWAEAPSMFSASSLPSSSFPLLEELKIGCGSLKTMPTLFPKIRKLEITSSSSAVVMTLGTSGNFTSLTSLAISKVSDLTELPPRLLLDNKLLQHMQIINCHALQTFPGEGLRYLNALEEMDIGEFAEALESFTFLPVLDGEKGDLFLRGLKTLTLRSSHIAFVPKQIEHLTTIESLSLRLPNVAALPDWLGSLSSLRRLDLSYCKRLMHLPSTMRGLALKELNIFGCDQLVPRCAKRGGEEWHKISHIPWIRK